MASELVRPDHWCDWIREGKAETEGGVSWKTVRVWGADNGVRDTERGVHVIESTRYGIGRPFPSK